MPELKEQQRIWRQELRERQAEILFPGTKKELHVSPAEQIRYEEHAKVGALVAEDLRWIVSQDQSIQEAALNARFQAQIESGLTPDQTERLRVVRDKLLKQYHITQKVGRAELLHRVETAADRLSGGLVEFRPSNLPEEDREVTPLGAILFTIRDAHAWEDELGLQERTKGVTVRYDEEMLATLSYRERDALRRVIFLRATDDGPQQAAVRRHELFHDLYEHVLKDSLKVAYTNPTQAKWFRKLQNELIAYAISGDWQVSLSALVNVQKQGNKRVRERIAASIEESADVTGEAKEKLRAQAERFKNEISALEYHLCRLALSESTAFLPWIQALIAAESVKELVYHLSRIPSDPHRRDEVCCSRRYVGVWKSLRSSSLGISKAVTYSTTRRID